MEGPEASCQNTALGSHGWLLLWRDPPAHGELSIAPRGHPALRWRLVAPALDFRIGETLIQQLDGEIGPAAHDMAHDGPDRRIGIEREARHLAHAGTTQPLRRHLEIHLGDRIPCSPVLDTPALARRTVAAAPDIVGNGNERIEIEGQSSWLVVGGATHGIMQLAAFLAQRLGRDLGCGAGRPAAGEDLIDPVLRALDPIGIPIDESRALGGPNQSLKLARRPKDGEQVAHLGATGSLMKSELLSSGATCK
jgi:hypothetical protein